MLDELKAEDFEKRCFHEKPSRKLGEVNLMDTYEFHQKKKTTKNPLVWKPDKFRFSKEMKHILESKGFAA